jgi:hypothetical protein
MLMMQSSGGVVDAEIILQQPRSASARCHEFE